MRVRGRRKELPQPQTSLGVKTSWNKGYCSVPTGDRWISQKLRRASEPRAKAYTSTVSEPKELVGMSGPRLAYKGVEFQFVGEVGEDLICVICQDLLHCPMLTSCGHLFCYKCLKKTKDKKNCPVCRKDFSRSPFKDEFHDRKIKNLRVHCVNQDKGCGWVGELGHAHEHIQHASCGHLPIICPNRCSESRVPFDQVEVHLKACSEQEVPCDYATLGCKVRMKRHLLAEHLMSSKDQHLTAALATVTQLQATVQRQQDQLSTVGVKADGEGSTPWLANTLLYPAAPWVAAVENFTLKKREGADVFLYSKPFYSAVGGYKFCLKVYPNGMSSGHGTHLSVYLCLMRGENDDQLKWPFDGSVTVTMLNQRQDGHHHSLLLWDRSSVPPDFKKRVTHGNIASYGRGVSRFFPHKDLSLDLASNTHYLAKDTLYFRIEVTPPPPPTLPPGSTPVL